MTGDQIITLCLGIGNFIISVLVVVISSLLFNKREKIYMKRQEAVYDAMKFLDNYLSWLRFGNDKRIELRIPIRDLEYDTTKMTLEGRAIYNNLISSCKDEEIVETFISIIFNAEDWASNYIKFRNLCRKELGLNEIENLSTDKVFLYQIYTNDLEKHSQNFR